MRRVGWVLVAMILLSTTSAFSQEDKADWIKRLKYGIDIGSDQKPSWYFETVQPLYQSDSLDRTLFIQPRANTQGNDETINLGLGYRWLAFEDNWLLGVNTFYDTTTEERHYRIGFGLEAIGKVLEFRSNAYIGLSDKRTVSSTSGSKTYEEVVNGADIEFGGPIIPHMPWIKLYGSGYWFDHKHSDNREGWRLRTRLDPIKCVSADIIVWDDNKGDTEIRADISVNIPFDKLSDFKDVIGLKEESYSDRDLKEFMLIPVERDYEVKVEKWIETATATIEIKRGD